MSNTKIIAKKRDGSLNPRQLRTSGKVPATLYGKGMESVSIEMDAKEFTNTYRQDRNAIFEISIGKENFNAIVKNVQVESTTGKILNAELKIIKADVKIKVTVPVEFTGVSMAVKSGAELITNMTEIEVECLPSDIPHSIIVNVAVLAKAEDAVQVGDITYPQGVTPAESKNLVVVKASLPKPETEAASATTSAEPELV